MSMVSLNSTSWDCKIEFYLLNNFLNQLRAYETLELHSPLEVKASNLQPGVGEVDIKYAALNLEFDET